MEKNYYKSIGKNILKAIILAPGIPFILILGIGYYYFTTSVQTTTIDNIKRIVEDHRHMIESFLEERKADLEFVADSYSPAELSRSEILSKVLLDLQKKSGAFADLGIFNEDGLHVAYQGMYKLKGKNYKEAFWFKEVINQNYYISDIFLGYRRVPHFIIAITSIVDGKKWVIRASIDSYIFNKLVEKVRIGKTGEAYLLNSKGILQTACRSGGNLMDKPIDNIGYNEKYSGIKSFIKKDVTGRKFVYSTTWLKDKKWLLVARQEKSDAFSAFNAALYLIIVILVIGGVVITGVAFYMTTRIVRRLERVDSEKESINQQLIGASRLAELGEMATGFAHEINNPLQVIKSEQSLMEMILSDFKESGQLPESENLKELEDSMKQIEIQIGRCSKITQAILKFGRQKDTLDTKLDAKNFIPEIVSMVTNRANDNGIAIHQEIENGLSSIKGDPAQLQQVLLNLLNNAIHAIIEKHGVQGGELFITAESGSNDKIKIKVKDNGMGIDKKNLEKIFSPFFTTKPVGKGTGLGLSVCFGIIDKMGGIMEVESKKGAGATFTITLPAAK